MSGGASWIISVINDHISPQSHNEGETLLLNFRVPHFNILLSQGHWRGKVCTVLLPRDDELALCTDFPILSLSKV